MGARRRLNRARRSAERGPSLSQLNAQIDRLTEELLEDVDVPDVLLPDRPPGPEQNVTPRPRKRKRRR